MIRLRPYRESDADKVVSWCEDERTFYLWTAGLLGTYPITTEKLAQTAETIRFIALDGTEPAGFFTMRHPTDDPDVLRFGFVIVDPARRGNGIGREMLSLGLDFALRIYKAQRITLGVFEDNAPARACYATIGFAETGDTIAYDIDGREWTCVEMEYRQ